MTAANCAPKVNSKLVLKPGDLRQLVTVQQFTEEKLASGAYDQEPQPTIFATVWCSIQPVSGRWAMIDGQTNTTGYFKIRMRYLPGLIAKHRIAFGSRTFRIKEIMNIDERNIVHELTVQEDQSGG